MTIAEMKIKFENDGWSNVNFAELELAEATQKGYSFIIDKIKKGHEFFKMLENENIYNSNGDIVIFNIPCIKTI